jgi:hypothetical protein
MTSDRCIGRTARLVVGDLTLEADQKRFQVGAIVDTKLVQALKHFGGQVELQQQVVE